MYRCNCGLEVKNKKELIKHYKEVHPTEGDNLYDQIETVGDPFCDTAIKNLRERIANLEDASSKSKTYDESVGNLFKAATKENVLLVLLAQKPKSEVVQFAGNCTRTMKLGFLAYLKAFIKKEMKAAFKGKLNES